MAPNDLSSGGNDVNGDADMLGDWQLGCKALKWGPNELTGNGTLKYKGLIRRLFGNAKQL